MPFWGPLGSPTFPRFVPPAGRNESTVVNDWCFKNQVWAEQRGQARLRDWRINQMRAQWDRRRGFCHPESLTPGCEEGPKYPQMLFLNTQGLVTAMVDDECSAPAYTTQACQPSLSFPSIVDPEPGRPRRNLDQRMMERV